MKYYKMYTYDLWREAYPGEGWHWQVNDVYDENLIVGIDDERCRTDKELEREIRNALNPRSRMRFHFEGDLDYTLYVERERDWKPLFELRRMSDEEMDGFLCEDEYWKGVQVCISKQSRKINTRRMP